MTNKFILNYCYWILCDPKLLLFINIRQDYYVASAGLKLYVAKNNLQLFIFIFTFHLPSAGIIGLSHQEGEPMVLFCWAKNWT